MSLHRFAKIIFIGLVFLALLTPLIFFRELLFPFTTSKAFFFRSVVEFALPFYLYLFFANKTLRPSLKNPLNFLVLAFLLVNLLSAIAGLDFARSFWGMFERMDGVYMLIHLGLMYFYILMLGKLDGSLLEKLLKVFTWISAVCALNGVIGFLGGPTLTPDLSLPARASSTLGNPIFFASFLILPMFLSAFFALRSETKFAKFFYWSLTALQLLAIFLSGTRGAMAGLLGGAFFAGIFYLFLQKEKKIRKFGLCALGIMIIMAGLLYYFAPKLPQNSTIKRLFTLSDSNTQSRLIQWGVALKGVKEHAFLGTGPNNYFVVSNEHYDPEIWQYDRGWFDKPHNYQLEILLTTGFAGLAVYLVLVLAAFRLLYKAFRNDLLSLFEACLLAAGFIAYQFQNLFVFDTVAASLAFYLFLGFVGYLWTEAKTGEKDKKNLPSRKSGRFAAAVLWAGLPIMLYVFYATNMIGYKVAKALNIAKVFQTQDFDVAKSMYDKVNALPFNVYWKDFAYEYSNFAAEWSNKNQSPEQLEKSKATIDEALAVSQKATETHPLDPTIWLKLANVYFAKSHIQGLGFSQEAYDFGLKALELAPKKHDAKLFLAQVAVEGRKPELAQGWLEEILKDYPNLDDARWQLGSIYFFFDRKTEAEELALESLSNGYRVDQIKKGDWLLTYYYESGQPEKALEFLFTQSRGNENNADYFARLADAYNKSGRFVEARGAALKVLELDPASKTDVEAFLQSLGN